LVGRVANIISMDKIMNVELSVQWKGLSIDRYDEMTDYNEHVDVYVT